MLTAGENIKVKCTVSNTGTTDGAEVVQVYVGKLNSKVDRAKKELKGFQKTALAKRANASVEISIKADDLAFYDESISGWNLEKGDYLSSVGTASDQIIKEIKFSIK